MRTKLRRIRSRSPNPDSFAIVSASPCSSISRAASRRRFSTAWPGTSRFRLLEPRLNLARTETGRLGKFTAVTRQGSPSQTEAHSAHGRIWHLDPGGRVLRLTACSSMVHKPVSWQRRELFTANIAPRPDERQNDAGGHSGGRPNLSIGYKNRSTDRCVLGYRRCSSLREPVCRGPAAVEANLVAQDEGADADGSDSAGRGGRIPQEREQLRR